MKLITCTHPEQGTFAFAVPPDKPLQLLAVKDVGRAAAAVLADPQKYSGEGGRWWGRIEPLDSRISEAEAPRGMQRPQSRRTVGMRAFPSTGQGGWLKEHQGSAPSVIRGL